MSKILRQKTLALRVVQVLQSRGYTAYFAGGCVRDRLMGRIPRDYDVATSARPEEVEALFPRTVPIGKAFGVVAVVDGKQTVEVATFRSERGTVDGRHPESVTFCAAEEDALRRDFTINGMFYDPVENQLHDYVNGQRDLEKRIIAAIGDPFERFEEDHLRMLRAVRFAHTLGFTLDERSANAIRSMAHPITRISAERIEMELTRTLIESRRPGDALRHLHELGLLDPVLPEITPMIGQEQPARFHPEGDVFEHTVLMLNLMNEQAGMPAPQSTPDAKHVGQASLPAHPEEVLAENPFRSVEQSESLHTKRRRLPHWIQDHRIYFVTFRRADSIAQEKLNQWKEELENWQKNQPAPDSDKMQSELARRYRRRQQEWLDQGHGDCLLGNPKAADIVEEALLHFDAKRYRLGQYVIMPNHVHLIVLPLGKYHLSDIMHSWKSFSAQKINKLTARKGTLWPDESFDHIIQNEYHLEKFSTYIRRNPDKARLQPNCYRLGKGSLNIANQDEQAGMPATQSTPDAQHAGQGSLPARKNHAYTARELA